MKNKSYTRTAYLSLIVLLVIALVGVGLLLSGAVFAKPNGGEAASASHFLEENANTQTGPAAYTAEAGGVWMQLSDLKVSSAQLSFKLCYEVPFESDWAADRMALIAGERELRDQYATMLLEGMTQVEGRSVQCTLNRFQLPAGISLAGARIVIERIATSAPEQPDCEAAQQKLIQSGVPIRFTCQHGEYSFGFEVLEKPAEMSDLEARAVVSDAFQDVITGPWVFEVSMEQ